jgi:hypothetical protein
MMPMGIVMPMMVPADNVTGRSTKSESVKNQESQISCWHLTPIGEAISKCRQHDKLFN